MASRISGPSRNNGASFTRRGFIGLSGGVATASLLAACSGGGGGGGATSGGGGGGGGEMIFWNMPWGLTSFAPTDKKLTEAYKPKSGLPDVKYKSIQWSNFVGTFATAVASKTGPAVSSGGGTQAFQYAAKGKIAYADDLLDSWKKNGLYDDFIEGTIDVMKTDNGYAAVPYNLDVRVMWHNEALLKKAGAEVPTDWPSYMDACAALKKIGVYGYGTAAGQGANVGYQGVVSFMINNGGGFFNKNEEVDCVTPENIEAVEFILEMVKKGYVDPGTPGYSNSNNTSQWKARKFAMGINTPGFRSDIGDVASEVKVTSPLTSPSGKKGVLYFPNNIMMWKNSPSQKGSEAFLTYYYKNMSVLWTKKTGIGLPPLKSITQTKEFQSDEANVKIINDYLPVVKTFGAAGDHLFLGCVAVDATPPVRDFGQAVLGGTTDAKSALATVEKGIKSAITKLKS